MNLGFSEMLFIFVFALIIFGPKKLPEIGRQIGKALAEFKRATNDFKYQLESEMRQIELQEALKKERDRITQALEPLEGTIATGSLGPTPATETASTEPQAAVPSTAETNIATTAKVPDAGASGESTTTQPADEGREPTAATVTAGNAAGPEIKSEAAKGPNA